MLHADDVHDPRMVVDREEHSVVAVSRTAHIRELACQRLAPPIGVGNETLLNIDRDRDSYPFGQSRHVALSRSGPRSGKNGNRH